MGTAISGGSLERFTSACFVERLSTATVDTIGPGAGPGASHRAVTRIRRSVNGVTLLIPMMKCRGLSMATKAELQARVDQLEKVNADLERMLARAQRELEGRLLPEEQQPDDITNTVRKWMHEYQMPWEVFWCADHHQWVDELCSSFPYDIYAECPGCRGKESE